MQLFQQSRLYSRKRSLSFGMIPISCSATSSSSKQLIYGPTVARDAEFMCTPRLRTTSGSTNSFCVTSDVPYCHSAASHCSLRPQKTEGVASRHRQTSGDSGIFASMLQPPARRLSSTEFPLSSDQAVFDDFEESPFPDVCQVCAIPDGLCNAPS